MTSGTIGMPTGMPPQSWWAQLTTGSGDRKIERAAAEWVCGQLLGETLGAGQGARIQFDADATIAEVIDALERAAGPRARQTARGKGRDGPRTAFKRPGDAILARLVAF